MGIIGAALDFVSGDGKQQCLAAADGAVPQAARDSIGECQRARSQQSSSVSPA